MPVLRINWKPDILLILLSLLRKHFSKARKLRLDDNVEKARDEHFQEVEADHRYMFARKDYEAKGKGRKVKDKR